MVKIKPKKPKNKQYDVFQIIVWEVSHGCTAAFFFGLMNSHSELISVAYTGRLAVQLFLFFLYRFLLCSAML